MAGQIQADTYTNSAGTGAPAFTYGITPPFSWGNSYAYASNPTGYGSVGTATLKFSAHSNAGTDITYNSSASNGDNFTVNSAGLYLVSATISVSSSTDLFGITRNGVTSTSVLTQRQASWLVVPFFAQTDTTSTACNMSGVLALAANDVIRVQADASAGLANNAAYGLFIARIL